MSPRRRAKPLLPFAAVAAVLLALCGSAAVVRAADAAGPKLWATAGESADWLVREGVARPSEEPATFDVLRRRESDATWTLITHISEAPAQLATFGERLVILFEDGRTALVSIAGPTAALPPPEGYVPLAMCRSTTGGLLFLARRTDVPTSSRLVLFEFDGGAFAKRQDVWLNVNSARVQVVDAAGGIICLLRGRELVLIRARDETAVARLPDIDGAAALVSGGEPLVVLRQGERLSLLRPSAADQTAPVTLREDVHLATQSTAVTIERDELTAWWLDGGMPVSQRFDVKGTALAEKHPLETTAPPSPPLFERVLYVIGAGTMLVALVAGGRQTMSATPAHDRARPLPRAAPLARRLAAGIVDLLPLAGVCAYLIAGSRVTLFAGMLRFDGLFAQAILAAGVLLNITLQLACELRWGCTAGKALFALRVVGLDGTRAGRRGIVVRNVLRLVDLNLVTLAFVPMTPLRQRLGDFLAGTLVVDAADVRANAPITRSQSPDDLADQ